MGKKSRRKEGKGSGATAKSSASADDDMPGLEGPMGEDFDGEGAKKQNRNVPSMSSIGIPLEASCWWCLEEGPDDDGQPLVRDCSCRGSSGCAHFSCLVEYAEKKSLEFCDNVEERGYSIGPGLTMPWKFCRNCNQRYQGALSVNLMDSMMAFMIRSYPIGPHQNPMGALLKPGEFPCHPLMYVQALDAKGDVIYDMSVHEHESERACYHGEEAYYLEETKKIASELLATFEKMKVHPALGPNMPKELVSIEATANWLFGHCLVELSCSLKGHDMRVYKPAMEYITKSHRLFASIGDTANAAGMEQKIAETKDIFNVTDETESGGRTDILLKQYKENPKPGLAESLWVYLQIERRSIECERIISEEVVRSRRVHGPNHEHTVDLERKLELCRIRKVFLEPPYSDPGAYHTQRYEDDGKKCVLKGPTCRWSNGEAMIAKEEDMKVIVVDSELVALSEGIPVACHGLKNATHLNGKIGDARRFDTKAKRWSVHFEDKTLKPCLVKPENLRILFDLPPKVD